MLQRVCDTCGALSKRADPIVANWFQLLVSIRTADQEPESCGRPIDLCPRCVFALGLRLPTNEDRNAPRHNCEKVAQALASYIPTRPTPPDKSIAELDVSVRARIILNGLGVNTLSELTKLTRTQIHETRSAGQTTLTEIERVLEEHGLSLAD